MANKFSRISLGNAETRFSQAVTGELVFSRFDSDPRHITSFNAGDIVPIGCFEVLPHDDFEMDLDSVIRQTTVLTPTMGSMYYDVYAVFCPNRVVNQSWKTVQGENPNGSWTAPQIDLVPLVGSGTGFPVSYQVPVGSVADYYGFPTQAPIPIEVLQGCHDLKFRGYVEIYNQFFRDQNYQPPIPYSKLNVYEGFFDHASAGSFSLAGNMRSDSNTGTPPVSIGSMFSQDNSVGVGSIEQAIYGNMTPAITGTVGSVLRSSVFNALGAPLKANKLHDYFTTVAPSPQKGPEVLLPLSGNAPVLTSSTNFSTTGQPLRVAPTGGGSFGSVLNQTYPLYASSNSATNATVGAGASVSGQFMGVAPANLYADLSQVTAATLSDLRMAAAVQQVYEALSYGGSRYNEYCRIMFGIDVDNPFKDEPTLLGHFRRELELYQTAQTSASQDGGTAQGNLAAFGYTANANFLFKQTFLEHGYVHVLAVVRHKNVYSSFLARDNFRLSQFDFYQPPLANISMQPVYTKQINPFAANAASQDFGYQEAWAEYRYDPDMVSGLMRPFSGSLIDANGRSVQSLGYWNYADNFNSSLQIATADWLKSNSEEVLNRTLAVTSEVSPQIYGYFRFRIKKNRPMPTYSLPGLDVF